MLHVNTLAGNTWEEVDAPSDIGASAAAMNNKQLPSFFQEIYNLNNFCMLQQTLTILNIFWLLASFQWVNMKKISIATKTKITNSHSFCVDFFQQKLRHLDYNFEKVLCPYSYLKVHFILAEKVVRLQVSFLIGPLFQALNFNRINGNKECMVSLLWRKIDREQRRRFLPESSSTKK